jgi:DDE superfamily endonuclease
MARSASAPGGWEGELERWLAPFLAALRREAQRRWAVVYLKGLILPGERKSVEPLAARVAPGSAEQLHHLIGGSPWATGPLEAVLAREADRLVGGPDAVLVVDDTALPKQGRLSVGVKRQCCGRLGKWANSDVRRQRFGARRRDPAALRAAEVRSCCAEPEAEPLGRRLADSDARVGHRIPVCSSGAASICQRASADVGRPATQFARGFPTGAPPAAPRSRDVVAVRSALPGGVGRAEAAVRDQAAGRGSICRPIAHRKAAISRAIAVVTTVWRLPAAVSRR